MGHINKTKKREDFDSVLLKAVDEGLMILGVSVRITVYHYLKKDHDLRREDIPKNPEALDIGLRTLFGSGASVIERHVLERLCAKLGLIYEEKEDESFIHYIKEARQMTATQSLKPPSQYN